MKFETKGINIHNDRVIPLFIEEKDRLLEDYNDNFRLLVLESGSIHLELNMKPYFVESPALLCLNSDDVILIKNIESVKLKTIYFKPEIINSKFHKSFLTKNEIEKLSFTEYQDYVWLFPFLEQEEEDFRYIKLGPTSLKQIISSFNLLKNELENQHDVFWPCRSRSYFLEALFLLQNMKNTYDIFKNRIEENKDCLEEVIVYVHTHYMEDISLPMLVEKFGINRTKLNNLFLQTTGKSVIKYLIELRIKLACLILRDTLKPIKEVAYQTGFRDITHFGRTFKTSIDINPTQYREKYNWMLS